MRKEEEEQHYLFYRWGYLDQQLQKTKSRLNETKLVTDKSVLIADTSITLEFYKHMFSCFEIFNDKYGGLMDLGQNILRQQSIQLVINLPALKTLSFERYLISQLHKDSRFWLKRSFSLKYFERRFEYSFESLNNSTPNQLFTLNVKGNRLYHLSIDLRSNRSDVEINEEIKYFLVSIASILSTIKECMLNDWVACKR